MRNNSGFFANRDCEYFPCHKAAKEEEFNCMFCYCPLYMLGRECGGDATYTADGIKDCSSCTIPHRADAAAYIASKWPKISRRLDGKED